RAGAARVRGGLLGGGRRERDVRVRPAGGGGHAVRDPGDVLPGLADHGAADLPGGGGRRQRVLGVVVRHGAHLRDGRLLLPRLPPREVEGHAGNRAGDGGGVGRGEARGRTACAPRRRRCWRASCTTRSTLSWSAPATGRAACART